MYCNLFQKDTNSNSKWFGKYINCGFATFDTLKERGDLSELKEIPSGLIIYTTDFDDPNSKEIEEVFPRQSKVEGMKNVYYSFTSKKEPRELLIERLEEVNE